MAESSLISWTMHTWNPWIGCTKCAIECRVCYAIKEAARKGIKWGDDAERYMSKGAMGMPYKWQRKAIRSGESPIIFCASLADVFEDNRQVEHRRQEVWKAIKQCDRLDFLLLTKRPQNVKQMVDKEWLDDWPEHVWIGTSVGHSSSYSKLNDLLDIPAKTRVVSAEPLLEELDLEPWLSKTNADGSPKIAAVMIGGETGRTANPMEPAWVRKLIKCCEKHGVIAHFKQHGAYRNETQLADVGLTVDDVRKRETHTCADGTTSYRILGIKRKGTDGVEKGGKLLQHIFDGKKYLEMPNPRNVKRPTKAPDRETIELAQYDEVIEAVSCGATGDHDDDDDLVEVRASSTDTSASMANQPAGGKRESEQKRLAVSILKSKRHKAQSSPEGTHSDAMPGVDGDAVPGPLASPVLPADSGAEESASPAAVDSASETNDSEAKVSDDDRAASQPPQFETVVDGLPPMRLIHTTEGNVFAWMRVGQCLTALPVEGTAFRDQVLSEVAESEGAMPSQARMAGIIAQCRAKGSRLSKDGRVFTRVAPHDGALVIDLGSAEGSAVRVTASGWQIVDASPIPFQRGQSSTALPVPEKGGSVEDLEVVLPLPEHNFAIALGFVLASFMPEGPYPVLDVTGPASAGKTLLARQLKALTDPSRPELRHLPNDEVELFRSAQGNRVLAFDNVSRLTLKLSDALCTLSTGNSIAKPKRGMHGGEVVLAACCPVILNGAVQHVVRGDLQQRVWSVELPPHGHQDHRIEESALTAALAELGAKAFGLILDMLASGLKHVDAMQISSGTRLIKAARWVEACGKHIGWQDGYFLSCLEQASLDGIETAIEDHPLLEGLVALLADIGEFSGTLSELRGAIADRLPPGQRTRLPAPNKLRNEFRLQSQVLQAKGIDMEPLQRTSTGRPWRFSMQRAGSRQPANMVESIVRTVTSGLEVPAGMASIQAGWLDWVTSARADD